MMKEISNMKNEYVGEKAKVNDFIKEETVIVVVDMVKGFVDIGNMASPRVKEMSPNIKDLLTKFKGTRKVFFQDSHTEDSREFKAFSKHCSTEEEMDITEDLKEFSLKKESVIIKKNSTNGFITSGFESWLNDNKDVRNFIVVGCVTDMCISDFARSLNCYICEHNLDKTVTIPVNCVETFEAGSHNADIMNIVTLYGMKLAGIKIVDEIL